MDRLLSLIQYRVPRKIRDLLPQPDGVSKITETILDMAEVVMRNGHKELAENPRHVEDFADYTIWHDCVEFYMYTKRETDGLWLASELYNFLNKFQMSHKIRVHTGDVLWMMSYLHDQLARPWHAQRCRLLAICEDALTHISEFEDTIQRPIIGSPSALTERYLEYAASYPFLKNQVCLTDREIELLFDKIRRAVAPDEPHNSRGLFFPEAILSRLCRIDPSFFDKVHRITASANDHGIYVFNQNYIKILIDSLENDADGKILEELALYLMSCIPGCRAYPDGKTTTRDAQHDVYGGFDGFPPDFRSEIHRYFICECKNYKYPVTADKVRSFHAKIVDSHSNFGILFSKNGITGNKTDTAATATRRDIFSKYQTIIAVIGINELTELATDSTSSFLDILRREYEAVKFNMSTQY